MCFVYEKLATTLRGGSRSVQTDGGRPLVVYSAMAQSTLRKRSLQPLTSISARQQAGTAQSVRLRRCQICLLNQQQWNHTGERQTLALEKWSASFLHGFSGARTSLYVTCRACGSVAKR